MKKIWFIVCLLCGISHGDDIKKIINLKSFIYSLDAYTLEQNLDRINFYFNQIISEYDSPTNRYADNWDSIIDFILKGQGDCEEYAISKYVILETLPKVQKNKLFLMLTRENTRPSNELHLVLAYYHHSTDPLILDNLSSKILPISKRADLTPLAIFNTEEFIAFDDTNMQVKNASHLLMHKFKIAQSKSIEQLRNFEVFKK